MPPITEFTNIKDSFISAYNYSKILGVLTLVFNQESKKLNTTIYPAYSYSGVPLKLVKQMVNNAHPGEVFRTYIRNVYPARKLDPVEYKYDSN